MTNYRGGCLLPRHGQRHNKRRPLADDASHRDFSAHVFNDIARNIKAQSRAAAPLSRGKKRLKDSFLVFLTDPMAGVADLNFYLVMPGATS